jgi:amphi-Trp domain-containing protein
MTSKAKNFRHESLQDSRAVARYLQALAEGFEKGQLQFSDQDGEIVLEPHGMMRFGVTADQKSGRHALTVRFTWKQEKAKGGDPGPLLINGAARAAAREAAEASRAEDAGRTPDTDDETSHECAGSAREN